MKKSYILSVFLFVFATSVFAQQDAQFTLFQWATPYYNAGAIGEQSNTLCFTGIFRQQYTGWNDYIDENGTKYNTSPQQIYFSMESYLRKLHGSLGVSVIKDKIGYFNNNVNLRKESIIYCLSSKSGLRRRVHSIAWSSSHSRILASLPLRRISGTFHPL